MPEEADTKTTTGEEVSPDDAAVGEKAHPSFRAVKAGRQKSAEGCQIAATERAESAEKRGCRAQVTPPSAISALESAGKTSAEARVATAPGRAIC